VVNATIRTTDADKQLNNVVIWHQLLQLQYSLLNHWKGKALGLSGTDLKIETVAEQAVYLHSCQ
jgi:hypothetical protein